MKNNSHIEYKYVKITKLSPTIGAYIDNIDINDIYNNNILLDEIKNALYDNLVIFIKNQRNLSLENYIKFSKLFGVPTIYYNKKNLLYPGVAAVERLKDSKEVPIGATGWHSDSAFLENPPTITMLYSKNIPKVGGDTLFSNCYEVYNNLSNGMKNILENLEGLNSSNLRSWLEKKFDYENLSDNPIQNFHKIIKTHPVTKKKSIYVNSVHTHYIKNFHKDESEIILNYIFEKIKNEDNCYRHKWEEDTIAIWDNRCCQHLPIDDCQGEYRLLWRIILEDFN